jgi:signal transduction histidine kinase
MFDEKVILDAIDGGVIVVDSALTIRYWNGWLKVATGIGRDEAITKKLDELMDIEPVKLATLRRNIKTTLGMGIMTFMSPSAHGYLLRVPIKNPFLTSFDNMQQEVKIVRFDEGDGTVGIFITDQTAVMDSQRVVRLEQQKISDILDAQKGLLFVTDGREISLANQKFLSFFGYDSIMYHNINIGCFARYFENIDGCFWIQCGRSPDQCKWLESIASESNEKRFVAVKDRAGELVYFILHVTRATKSKSEYIVTLTEASQEFLYQKKLEILVENEMAKRLDQERLLVKQSRLAILGEMIAAISHQMRQPLSAIKMLATDIEYLGVTGELDTEQVNIDTKMIYEQVEYMNDTITSFRNFLMPSGDDSHFDIINAIKDVAKLLSALLKELDMELCIELGGTKSCLLNNLAHVKPDEFEQIVVLGSAIEFKQALINLISNTKDALNELKKRSGVVVRTVIIQVVKGDDGLVTLRYRDTAGGIPAHILPELFSPYKTSKGDQGTGIGMYMSKQIIEKMGGTIKAANIAGGAMFTITLKGYDPTTV